MKPQQSERKLPADVFDTIDLTSLVNGGIGAGKDYEFVLDQSLPCCVHGQAHDAEGGSGIGVLTAALFDADINRSVSDAAVNAINSRKGAKPYARVDFLTEYCPELNIVRGD